MHNFSIVNLYFICTNLMWGQINLFVWILGQLKSIPLSEFSPTETWKHSNHTQTFPFENFAPCMFHSLSVILAKPNLNPDWALINYANSFISNTARAMFICWHNVDRNFRRNTKETLNSQRIFWIETMDWMQQLSGTTSK